MVIAIHPNINLPPLDPECLFLESQAADFLQLDVRTLQNWRINGRGPQFVRLSRKAIRYRRSDLIAFAAQRLANSTAEYKDNADSPN